MEDVKKIMQLMVNDPILGELLVESQNINIKDLLYELLINDYDDVSFNHRDCKFKIRFHKFYEFTTSRAVIGYKVIYIGNLSILYSKLDILQQDINANEFKISNGFHTHWTTYDIDVAVESLMKLANIIDNSVKV